MCVNLMPPEFSTGASLPCAFSLLSMFCRGHIMGMAVPIYYSAEMVRALPDDGNRYETVRGELLVTPAPRQP